MAKVMDVWVHGWVGRWRMGGMEIGEWVDGRAGGKRLGRQLGG